jgi:hypothetical protein
MRRYYSYRGENGADWVEADPETAEARMVSRYGGCWLRLEELIYVPGRGPLWDEDDLRKESPLSEEEFHRLWNMASKHERVSVGVSFNWPSRIHSADRQE